MADRGGPSGISGQSPRLVQVERDKVLKDVAVVTLQRSPSNLLSLRILRELDSILDTVEADDTYRGVILTSSVTGIFCSGLDIEEMHQKNFDSFRGFWKSLQDLWVRLYLSRLVTFAAMNGTAVAGGCLLAISCDFRIMAKGPYTFGFPETVIGLCSPSWVYEMLAGLVGPRKADISLQLGIEYPVREAAEIGLVDLVVPPKKLLEASREEMKRWLQLPDFSRAKTKQVVREPLVMRLRANPEGDTQNMYSFISTEPVQHVLQNVLKRLKTLELKDRNQKS